MMGTKVNSNYEDLLTFTRASKGHALRPVSYGSELVTNGTFDSDTSSWTASNATFTASGGVATFTATANIGKASQTIITTAGEIYRLQFDGKSLSSDTANVEIEGVLELSDAPAINSSITTLTSFTVYFVATSSSHVIQLRERGSNNNASCQVDNISVKEVTFDQPDGTLTLFEHPNNIPRVEYDADGNRLGLLVEEARTNLIPYSEDFTLQSDKWANGQKGGTSLTSGLTESPDRSESVWKLYATSGTGTQLIQENIIVSGSTNVAASVYLKKAEYKYGGIRLLDVSQNEGYSVFIDLDDGSVFDTSTRNSPTVSNYSIQDAGNGWWRLSVITSSDGGEINFTIGISDGTLINDFDAVSFAGDNTSGIYIWGAQFEQGSFPTSYIKTTGSTATRSADVASIPVADFGFNYTNTVGTFYAEFYGYGTAGARVLAAQQGVDRAIDINVANTSGKLDIYSNHTISGLYETGYITEVGDRVAAAMKENDAASVLNGGTVKTDTTTTAPVIADSLHIGDYNGAQRLNGHIKSIKYYPRRLTNAQIQALTEPRSTPTLYLTFDGLESSYTENYIHG